MKRLLLLLLLLAPLRVMADDPPPSDDEDGAAQAQDDEKEEDAAKAKARRGTPRVTPTLSPGGLELPTVQVEGEPRDVGAEDRPVPLPTSGPAGNARGAGGAAGAGSTPGAAGGDEAGSGAPAHKAAGERKVVPTLPDDVLMHIEYDNTEIKDVIKDFAEKTGRNFLIDPKISGKVTIISPRPVPKDHAYAIFLAALDSQGYTTVIEGYGKDGQPYLTRIIDSREAKSEPLEVYRGSTPNTANLITRIVQLENVSVDEVSKVITKMISGVGDLTTYNPSNMLLITDSGNNIRRLLDIIKELDISAPKQKLEVIQIKFAEAATVLEMIREIYGEAASGTQGAAPSTASSRAARRDARNRAATPAANKGAEVSEATATSVGAEPSFIGKMISDDRTNSIIVLATEKSLVDIKELIARIDYETDPSAGSDIHVIYLAHAKAEELSATLNSLIQSNNSRVQQNGRGTTGNARGGTNARNAPEIPAAQGAIPGEPGDLGNFSGEVRITHDVPTNALVVTASNDDFRRLDRVIEALDIRRKQVFVETVIMEVSDSERKDSGVSWHGGRPGDPSNPAAVNLIAGRGTQSLNLASALLDGSLLGGIGLGIFGNAMTIALPGVEGGIEIPMFGIVLRALQDDTSTNVLSAPNILTLDNEEASIEVGETVPFPTGGFLGGLGGAAGSAGLPSISFTREDVGIILRLTPQVNESDWVTLDIYQEISEVKEGSASDTLASGGPTTTKRSAETHVSVQSNQTIVIGGLMQEVDSETESKVPILGDIPLIGALFRNKIKTKRKTNLLIFLTPHVIDGPEDLQEIYRIKMLQREEFMRRFYGKTKQEQAEELNSLVRYSMNLPDSPSVYRDKAPRPKSINLTSPRSEGDGDPEVRTMLEGAKPGDVLITPDGEFERAVEPPITQVAPESEPAEEPEPESEPEDESEPESEPEAEPAPAEEGQ